MQLWDIGSQVNSLDMAANYLHNCDSALVVYDVLQREVSVDNVSAISQPQKMPCA
jgi:hypothetical protein